MKNRYWSLLFIGLVGISLFSYNYWSYSCGRCNAESLLAFSLPAKVLIAINALAFVALMLVRNTRHKSRVPRHCRCGASLHSDWLFCPGCGSDCRRNQ